MSSPFVDPIDRRGQPVAGDDLAASCLALPIGVLAVLDALPFDIHVRHGDRSVLYALRDATPADLLAHASPDLDLVVPIEHARPYRRQILACLADAACGTDRPVRQRARRIVTVLGPLLGPLVGEADIDPGGLAAAAAGLAIVSRAIGHDRELAERILDRPAIGVVRTSNRWVPGTGLELGRSIDAAIIAALVAPAVDALPEVAALAAAARDVGLVRGLERTPADRRHPLIAADLVAASGGSAAVTMAIASHHERLDGSGYPVGLGGDAIGPAGRAVALADSFVTMTRGISPNHGIPAADAFRALRIVTRGRFDNRAVIALADIVAGAAAAISGGFLRSAPH
jgi:hypothetical protein